MARKIREKTIRRLGVLGIIALTVTVSCLFIKDEAHAQDPQNGTPVDFEGTVDYVDANILVVDGIAIDIATVQLTGDLQVGMTIHVQGIEIQNHIVVAQQITIIIVVSVGTPTPTGTQTVTATPTATATSDGTTTPTSTPTATGTPNGTVTPNANGPLAVIIVVEGVVSYVDIEVNIVIINNVVIHVDEDDDNGESDDDVPIQAIHIGDWLRIEGESLGGDNIIVVVAIIIVFVDIDVFVHDGDFFRDDSNCNNPPPDWAPANGWRRRCEGQNNNGNGNNHHDDDDDD